MQDGTYNFFFLGPGFPLGLGVTLESEPSMAAALRFEPGLGPFRFGPGGPSGAGVVPSFMFVADSAGVSTGASVTGAAGVSAGDELLLEACSEVVADS